MRARLARSGARTSDAPAAAAGRPRCESRRCALPRAVPRPASCPRAGTTVGQPWCKRRVDTVPACPDPASAVSTLKRNSGATSRLVSASSRPEAATADRAANSCFGERPAEQLFAVLRDELPRTFVTSCSDQHGLGATTCLAIALASTKYCSKPEEVSESCALPSASKPSSRFSGSKRALILMSGPKMSAMVWRYCVSVIRLTPTLSEVLGPTRWRLPVQPPAARHRACASSCSALDPPRTAVQPGAVAQRSE